MSKGSVRTEAAKKEMLQTHYFYEFEMLIVALQIADSSFENPLLNMKKDSVVVDLTLVHARNLLDFYYRKPKHPQRPYAGEFLKDGVTWETIRPPMSEMIMKLQRQVDEDTQHLSYERVNRRDEERKWNIIQLFRDFLNVTMIFLNNVKEDYMNDSLRRIISRPKRSDPVVDLTHMSTSTSDPSKS